MAKAVTLKNASGEEVYPVTSIDLVVGASQPTVTTQSTSASGWFAPTWYKREYQDGRVIYTCTCNSISLTFYGSQWYGDYITTPVIFNAAKMSFSGCVSCPDSAITACCSYLNADSNINVHVTNQYSGIVTNTLNFNGRIEVFPD